MQLTNTGNDPLHTISLLEDLSANYGGAFRRIVGTPNIVASDATNDAEINPDYDGGLLDAEIFDNSGSNTNLLDINQSITVRIVIEVDADAPGAIYTAGNLVNQATVAGTGQNSGGPADDYSDDPTNGTNNDVGSDNNPDDPNLIRIPDITLEKSVTGTPVPATSGIIGNWEVTYTFSVTNTGTTTLNNLTVVDDWVGHFGGAFTQVMPGSLFITPGTAAVPPGANTSYTGAAGQNMLDGTGSFLPGQSFDVTLTVEVDPNATGAIVTANELVNQATTTGTDPTSSIVVDDRSDSPADGTDNDPDGDNNPDDPTTVGFSEIGLAKRIVQSQPTSTAGHYLLTYEFRIRNIGSVDLTDVRLTDGIAATLGSGFQNVVTPPFITSSTATTDPEANLSYNGSSDINLLDGTPSLLKPNEEVVVRVEVEIDIDQLTTTSNNQATATGDDGSGPVTDLSDTGSDPESTNPNQTGDSGGANDPTLPPAIGIAKNHGDPTRAGDNWLVPVTLEIRNLGLTDLTNLMLIENIAAEFSPAFVSASTPVLHTAGITAGTAPGLNTAWTGDTSLNMLDGSGTLRPGDYFTVTFDVIIDPDSTGTSQPLDNQAMITAEDPNNPLLVVIDTSDSGTTPSSNNPGEPGDTGSTEDPTPLQIPDISTGKQIVDVQLTGLQATLTIDLVVENTGTVNLNMLTLRDDFAAQYGANFVAINSAPTIISSTATTDPVLNTLFDGSSDIDLFDGTSGMLKPGEDIVVRLTVLVEAAPGQTSVVLENQSVAGGNPVDDSGNPINDDSGTPLGPVTDDSDSGTNPNTNNPGQPGDTGTTDDPTLTPITFFTFDAFNDFSDPFKHTDQGQPAGRMLTKEIWQLASEPMFSGSARPGTKIVGRLYDENGFQIGQEEVFADVGGNWMMQVHDLDHSRGTGYARVVFEEIRGMASTFTPNGDAFGYLGQDKMDNDYAALEPWTPYEEHYDFIAIYRGTARVTLATMHRKNSSSIGFGTKI